MWEGLTMKPPATQSVICFIITSMLVLAVSCTDLAVKYYNLGVEAASRNDLDEAIEMW